MRVAFLGLGVMGGPMAGHLAKAGFDVTVYNRTREKAEAWLKTHHGARADTPAAAAEDADVVLACVGDDPDAELIAHAAFEGMGEGTLYIDHTTTSPGLAERLAVAAEERSIGFVDAPVSGGQAGAEQARLTAMCGGTKEAVEKARPLLDTYCARAVHIGAAGTGQMTKCVNQICIAGVVQGLAEGMNLAETAGLDLDKVYEAISGGAAASWQMTNRWSTMAADEFEFGFAVEWMRKDLRNTLAEARAQGVSLPLTALVDQFYAEIEAQGGKRWDTSSLVRRRREG